MMMMLLITSNKWRRSSGRHCIIQQGKVKYENIAKRSASLSNCCSAVSFQKGIANGFHNYKISNNLFAQMLRRIIRRGPDRHREAENCVTQLKLYTGDKLSSPIFWCLSVCQSVRHRCHPTKSLPFPIYKGIQALADPVPPKTNQFQLILTKYQPVSSYTDPVPSSTTFNSSSR